MSLLARLDARDCALFTRWAADPSSGHRRAWTVVTTLEGCGAAFSFPSGHATAAMAVAFVYAVAFPTLAGPLISVAACVGLSRVYLGTLSG
jgi:membrane-associated phospholipid phosphatase